jgi:hypothetical protein
MWESAPWAFRGALASNGWGSKTVFKIIPAAIAAAALFAASTASAATMMFQFDSANSSINITHDSTFCFGSCQLSANLMTPFSDITLSQGQSQTFDFAQFHIAPGFGGGKADVTANLAFIVPDAGPASTDGKAIYGTLGGVLSAGGLVWDDPVQHFTTSDGSQFTVTFNNISAAGFGNSAIDTITITADSIAVPEPASWALLIVGVGMIGTVLRRRHSFGAAAA